jgi:hypothetical protein
MKIEDEPEEESARDRLLKYRALIASGMQDNEAKERVWPATTAGYKRNEKEKADEKADKKDKADKKEAADQEKKADAKAKKDAESK